MVSLSLYLSISLSLYIYLSLSHHSPISTRKVWSKGYCSKVVIDWPIVLVRIVLRVSGKSRAQSNCKSSARSNGESSAQISCESSGECSAHCSG